MKKAMVLLVAAVVTLQFLFANRAEAIGPPPRVQTTLAQEDAPSPDSPAVPGITDFRAAPARTRGRVDLSWKYSGRSFNGNFLVERSTNGGTWRLVTACPQGYDSDKPTYSCVDTNLMNGTTYAYRVCIVTKGTACTAAGATKPVTVKAP